MYLFSVITTDHARQLIMADVATSLFKLLAHAQDNIAQTAMSLLMAYVKYENMRPSIGNAGGIQYFVTNIRSEYEIHLQFEDEAGEACSVTRDEMEKQPNTDSMAKHDITTETDTLVKHVISTETEPVVKYGIPTDTDTMGKHALSRDKKKNSMKDKLNLVNALGLCCNESVNRLKIREKGGLELILELLNDVKFEVIHNRLLSALVCFLYDDPSLHILLKNDMIVTLLRQLRRVAKLGQEPEKDWSIEALEPDKCTELGSRWQGDALEPMKCAELGRGWEDTVKIAQINEAGACDSGVNTEQAVSDQQSHCQTKDQSDLTMVDHDIQKSDNIQSYSGAEVVDMENLPQSHSPDKEDKEPRTTSLAISESDLPRRRSSSALLSRTTTASTALSDLDVPVSDGEQTFTEIPRAKYSIDSPTYQAVSDFIPDEDYFKGPKNIMESEQSYFWLGSPEKISPPVSPQHRSFSPMITGWYSSPESSPPRPFRTPSPEVMPGSPARSLSVSSPPHSPVLWEAGQLSPVYSPIHSPPSPQWSPLQAFSPNSDEYGSPEHLASFLDSASEESPWWCHPSEGQEQPRYSSSEEESQADKDKANQELKIEEKIEKITLLDQSDKSLVSDDAFQTSSLDAGSVPTVSEFLDTSGLDMGVVPTDSEFLQTEKLDDMKLVETVVPKERRKRKLSQASSISSGEKKKRMVTVEARKNITKALKSDQSISMDLQSILLPKSVSERKTSFDDNPQEKGEMLSSKNPLKITEHNILVLLSRISYLPEAANYLVKEEIWACLTDYIIKGDKPLARCGRILLRMTKDIHCFEEIVLHMLPNYILYKLTAKNVHSPEKVVSHAGPCGAVDTQIETCSEEGNTKSEAEGGSSRQDEETSGEEVMVQAKLTCELTQTCEHMMVKDSDFVEMKSGIDRISIEGTTEDTASGETKSGTQRSDAGETKSGRAAGGATEWTQSSDAGETKSGRATGGATEWTQCSDAVCLSGHASVVCELQGSLMSSLSLMAESPYGQGALAHLLLSGPQQDRMKTATTITTICK